MFTIYRHINKCNGKCYVGQTKNDVEKRWQSGKGYSGSKRFYRAIVKYGWDNFEHEILETNIPTRELANEREIYYIDLYNSTEYGYNVSKGGQGGKYFGKSILQLDGDGKILARYASITEASKSIAVCLYSISKCCLGKITTAGGYRWCFSQDYDSCLSRILKEKELRKVKEGSMEVEVKERDNKPRAKRVIGVQVTEDVYEQLAKRSNEEWLTVPDIVRRLIREYLKGGND